jgi:hypothetical protein
MLTSLGLLPLYVFKAFFVLNRRYTFGVQSFFKLMDAPTEAPTQLRQAFGAEEQQDYQKDEYKVSRRFEARKHIPFILSFQSASSQPGPQ